MLRPIAATIMILATAAMAPATADTEAGNRPHVKAGPYGQCYLKSVPDEYWGDKGTSRLYRVAAGADQRVATFAWYSQRIDLHCHLVRDEQAGISVVRFGPWSRGVKAVADDLALAFYFNDRLLASHSTLDIAGAPDNVDASVSH